MTRGKRSLPVIETTVTYLEMRERPKRPKVPAPFGRLAILRAHNPTVSFYRYLYDTVGQPWNWTERRLLTDEKIAAIIHDPKVEIYVLYVDGVPGGYVELDFRQEDEIELAYFGLIPEFVGRGLGAFLLDWAIETAWSHAPQRLWVHTCTLDHPRALSTYQKAGFMPYMRRVEKVVPLSALRR